MTILSYRRMVEGKGWVSELYVVDLKLLVNPFGIEAVNDAFQLPIGVQDIEEMATEHVNEGFLEMCLVGIRLGVSFARMLQHTPKHSARRKRLGFAPNTGGLISNSCSAGITRTGGCQVILDERKKDESLARRFPSSTSWLEACPLAAGSHSASEDGTRD